MGMQQTNQENILIPKETFESMMRDFEHLLEDFEEIMEQNSMKVIEKRLKEVKEGKVKGLTDKDFRKFLKSRGIDAK